MIDNYSELLPFFVLLVISMAFVAIFLNKISAFNALMLAATLFLVTGIVSMDDILISMSNSSIVLIMLLIIIAAGLIRHYPILKWIEKFTVTDKGYKPFLASSMALTAILSAFINNTAVVAFMTPYMHNWGIKHKISPSKLLMPLSFAAITGGMITLIGTSTTLVLNGFMQEQKLDHLNYFHLFIIGSSVTVAGIVYFILLGKKILPDKPELYKILIERKKDYLVELRINKESKLIGKKVSEAGLRNLESFYLAEIIRNKKTIVPVAPDMVLKKDDILIFAGETSHISQLLTDDNGLELPPKVTEKKEFTSITEVVLSHNSTLLGRTIKASDFRNRYDSAVIAVHRNGEKLSGKIGNIRLNAGDVLMLFTGTSFREKVDLNHDIYIISEKENPLPSKTEKKWPLFIIALMVFIGFFTNKMSMTSIGFIVLAVLFTFKIIRMRTIKREFDISLGGILVFSLVLGKAIIHTGTGQLIADFLMRLSSGSPELSLVFLILFTVILTTFITNVAAVSIVFPVAVQLSVIFPNFSEAYFISIAFGASAAFLTPISYQTNLMVVGPGGYKFKDFIRVGFPFLILYISIIIAWIYSLYSL